LSINKHLLLSTFNGILHLPHGRQVKSQVPKTVCIVLCTLCQQLLYQARLQVKALQLSLQAQLNPQPINEAWNVTQFSRQSKQSKYGSFCEAWQGGKLLHMAQAKKGVAATEHMVQQEID
jgi:hypothetical protein